MSLALDPTAGVVAPGESAVVTVEMSGAGLERGLHQAEIVVRTNDPERPQARVPVTLEADRPRSDRPEDRLPHRQR